MKFLVLLALLAVVHAASLPPGCEHREGHATDPKKISPAEVVDAGLKKEEKAVGDKPLVKDDKAPLVDSGKPLSDEPAPAVGAKTGADPLQGVVGPDTKKEVKSTEKDAKLPALTKDKVANSTDEKKADEKFLDLNIKNITADEAKLSVPKDQGSSKKKDDLKASVEDAELGDDAAVSAAKHVTGVLEAANKSLDAIGEALGNSTVPANATDVTNKTTTVEPVAEVKTAREIQNVEKTQGGLKFDVPLTDTKKDGIAKTKEERDLPIESLKDTKTKPEPIRSSQNQMIISEQSDEAPKDIKTLDKTKKSDLQDQTVEASKDTKTAVTDKAKKTDVQSDQAAEAPKETKISLDKTKKSDLQNDQAVEAPKDTKTAITDKVKKAEVQSDQAVEAPKDTKTSLDKTKKSDVQSDEAVEAPKDSKKAVHDKTKKADPEGRREVSDVHQGTKDIKAVEKTKEEAPITADKTSEQIVKPKTRSFSGKMIKRGLAGRNTPGFMTGSMFINV